MECVKLLLFVLNSVVLIKRIESLVCPDVKNNDLCISFCPMGTLLEPKYRVCLSKCPDHMVIVQDVCYNSTKCPRELPYSDQTNMGINCTDKCYGKKYLYDKQCLPLCSNSQHEKDQHNKMVCFKTCPPPLVLALDEDECVISCADDELIHDGKCIEADSCYTIIEGPICTNENECPSYYYEVDDGAYMIYEGKEYKINRRCKSKSPFTVALAGFVFALVLSIILLWFIMCNGRRNIHDCFKYLERNCHNKNASKNKLTETAQIVADDDDKSPPGHVI